MRTKLLLLLLGTTLAAFIWAFNYHYVYPENYEIKNFHYLRQPDGITCGPTSVTMVLNRYGKAVTLDEVKKSTKTEWITYKGEPIGMTSPEYIPVALTHFGLYSKSLRGDVTRLKYFVAKNRPPIVLLRSGSKTWHWVVVIGYTQDTIILADPGSGRREMRLIHFQSAWDFQTDMGGRPMSVKCTACKGTGRWLDQIFGPFSHCECCGGTGHGFDSLLLLLQAAEVYPRTMVVPKKNLIFTEKPV